VISPSLKEIAIEIEFNKTVYFNYSRKDKRSET